MAIRYRIHQEPHRHNPGAMHKPRPLRGDGPRLRESVTTRAPKRLQDGQHRVGVAMLGAGLSEPVKNAVRQAVLKHLENGLSLMILRRRRSLSGQEASLHRDLDDREDTQEISFFGVGEGRVVSWKQLVDQTFGRGFVELTRMNCSI